MPKKMRVVHITQLQNVPNGPIKEELVYFGEAIHHNLHMRLCDDGTTVKQTYSIYVKPIRGPFILKEAYR